MRARNPTRYRKNRSRRGHRRRSSRVPLVAGIALVVGGLIVAGYGFFQLVITDVIASRAQDQLAADFADRVDASLDSPIERADYVETVEGGADDPTMVSGRFDNEDDVPIMLNQGDPTGLDPLIPDAGLPWVYETRPDVGQAVGRIHIPAASTDWIIVEGTNQDDLRKGPGHMSHTPVPGQMGNAVISGHRTTYGAPFGDLDLVEPGDRITVETVIGTHTFEVIETRVVAPTDIWVTEQWEGSWLTLTTCHPRGSARQRLIVFARLIDGPNADSLAQQFDGDYTVPVPAGA